MVRPSETQVKVVVQVAFFASFTIQHVHVQFLRDPTWAHSLTWYELYNPVHVLPEKPPAPSPRAGGGQVVLIPILFRLGTWEGGFPLYLCL
jgi:hypothetical protein